MLKSTPELQVVPSFFVWRCACGNWLLGHQRCSECTLTVYRMATVCSMGVGLGGCIHVARIYTVKGTTIDLHAPSAKDPASSLQLAAPPPLALPLCSQSHFSVGVSPPPSCPQWRCGPCADRGAHVAAVTCVALAPGHESCVQSGVKP